MPNTERQTTYRCERAGAQIFVDERKHVVKAEMNILHTSKQPHPQCVHSRWFCQQMVLLQRDSRKQIVRVLYTYNIQIEQPTFAYSSSGDSKARQEWLISFSFGVETRTKRDVHLLRVLIAYCEFPIHSHSRFHRTHVPLDQNFLMKHSPNSYLCWHGKIYGNNLKSLDYLFSGLN